MTTAKEQCVRDAATQLHEAIIEAQASGLHVTWPRSLADLPAISISATAKTKPNPPADVGEPKKAKS